QTVFAISRGVADGFDAARARVVLSPVGIPVARDPGLRRVCAADPVQVVVVGTVDRHKRQGDVIAAVGELGARGGDARLTLYGPEADREYAATLRQQARDLGARVHFAGPTDDVAARLLDADVLVVPAGEVTPLVLMEAMALRTPVVAADMGGIRDVVTD